jgi:hypothetical protein
VCAVLLDLLLLVFVVVLFEIVVFIGVCVVGGGLGLFDLVLWLVASGIIYLLC